MNCELSSFLWRDEVAYGSDRGILPLEEMEDEKSIPFVYLLSCDLSQKIFLKCVQACEQCVSFVCND